MHPRNLNVPKVHILIANVALITFCYRHKKKLFDALACVLDGGFFTLMLDYSLDGAVNSVDCDNN